MWGRTANRTVPIKDRRDSPWFESSSSNFALFWLFWLAAHFRGKMELPKKKTPIGIQLKSTRRSETRDLRHVTPRRDENPPRHQGGAHGRFRMQEGPWGSSSKIPMEPNRHMFKLRIRCARAPLEANTAPPRPAHSGLSAAAVTPWCNTLRPAPHRFELLRSATSTTPHYTRKMRPGVRGACGSNTRMHVLARQSPIGLKARARFMSGEQQAIRDLSSTANCNYPRPKRKH